jgi:ATPase subunit of ABC transporter with duplicated ATPase domains
VSISLQVSDLSKSFNKPLFSGVNLTALAPVKIGLIGDNGSGKSTLLKILAGLEEADTGEVIWSRDIKMEYLEQEVVADTFDVSGGEKKIIKITQAFFGNNNVLLLDEPDNHLDLDHKIWFEGLVKEFKGIAIIISHDRRFLENAVDRIWYLNEEKIRDYPFAYGQFKEVFEGEMATRTKLWTLQEKERIRLAEFVKQMQIKAAANNKVTGAYHNAIHRYERWVKDMTEKPPEDKKLKLEINLGEQYSRKTALQLKGIGKAYIKNRVLENVNLHLFCGEKIAIAAPNGAGKSTLLNIIGGKVSPDGGEVRVGETLKLGYYAQEHLEALDEDATMIEELQKAKAFAWYDAISYLKRFLFEREQAAMQVKYLSGGQKSRLQLAKFLATSPDILLLDEPTNHLDLKTVLALENFLKDFEGTLLLVSHDREFTENICETVYELESGNLRRKIIV